MGSETPMQDEERLLWDAWQRDRLTSARDKLIERYLPYARTLAAMLYAKRHCIEFEFDDYLQFATIGLLESMERYQTGGTANFRTYASKRITGAILDGVENLNERQCQINARRHLQEERTDSLAFTTKDGQSNGGIFEQLADIAIGLALGYLLEDGMLYQSDDIALQETEYHGMALRQMQRRIQALVEQLPERERLVIKYHYFNLTPFETVATQWNITRGRVSQIHASALKRLQGLLREVKQQDIAW